MPIVRRLAAGFAVAAALVLAGSPALCADTPAPSAHNLALARHLFAGMHMDRMMDGMMKQVAPAMMAQARKTNPALTEEQAKAISESAAESGGVMMNKIMERMIPLYASTFTEKELTDAVAFYDGPSGQAMLNKMPVLMANMGPLMAEMMPEMQADVMKRVCAKTDCSKLTPPHAPKG